MMGEGPPGTETACDSWSNHKILNKFRRRTDTPNTASATPEGVNAVAPILADPDTSSRRSAEFLEFAQSAGGFGVFELNLVTGTIKGTSLFFELIGLECRDMSLSREEWLASIHPEDLEGVVHALSNAVASGGGYETEYRTLTANGEVRWLAGRGQVLLGGEGYDSRAIGTITDITERKELEDKLHYATESLNIAQTAAGVATFDFDFRRNSRFCSDNFRELLGIPPSTPLDDLNRALSRVHPDDFARVRGAPLETTPTDPYYRCEYRVLLDNGAERWIGEKAKVGARTVGGRRTHHRRAHRHQRLEAHQGRLGLGGNSPGTCAARHAGRTVGNRPAYQCLLVRPAFQRDLGLQRRGIGFLA